MAVELNILRLSRLVSAEMGLRRPVRVNFVRVDTRLEDMFEILEKEAAELKARELSGADDTEDKKDMVGHDENHGEPGREEPNG